GYSSLNMLKEIALDVLKLDIAFFRDTEGTPRERAVVESIVQMARALGMSTVAEGVEKQEQVEFLRSAPLLLLPRLPAPPDKQKGHGGRPSVRHAPCQNPRQSRGLETR
ncbi:MAG: EAL domain-containing protein, partial [Clostridioides difficile]|nr:EAL domain-containing protein [Clostridioides difficile]